MRNKIRALDRPFCFAGRITLEFFNNDDEDFKRRSLKELTRDLRRDFNISCVSVEENWLENPERGTLALALVAANHTEARALWDAAVKFVDEKAPARILSEDFVEGEIE